MPLITFARSRTARCLTGARADPFARDRTDARARRLRNRADRRSTGAAPRTVTLRPAWATESAPESQLSGSAWTRETGSFESEYGCTVGYEYYEPAEGSVGGADRVLARSAEPGLVILAHGFLRDLESTRGWARLWAGRGIRTVVLSFCNSGILDGRHGRNADDLIAAADLIAPGEVPVVYAGFSAGGLSALLAAGSDPRTTAYRGLDPVDTGELGASPAAHESFHATTLEALAEARRVEIIANE